MAKRVLYIVLMAMLGVANAQQFYPFGFQYGNIATYHQFSQALKNPFAGGMNSMQFARMDCNQDGVKDMVAFDVQNKKIRVFILQNGEYVYQPQYAKYFPSIRGFMQLIDFDGDGREDLFTYKNAGIQVYRNISDSILQFELFTDQIKSVYYQTPINLFCTEGDYLVIKDLDGDGDLDILAFWSLGKYVDYHRNMSVEKYSDLNHLEYEVVDRCYGHFSESEESNRITLNDDCGQNYLPQQKQLRHTGSTMLSMSVNHDKDLILGDMDYPNLVLLTNGGSGDSVYFVQQDTNFPSNSVSVNLYSMPCPMLLNISSDTIKDLLVSPFDLSLTKSENKESVWWYENQGTCSQPVFCLKTKSFLQEDMLDFGSGAFPVFADMNGDGLTDLLVGNYGYFDSASYNDYLLTCHYSAALAYFQNIGTSTNPKFQLVTDDFLQLRSYNMVALSPAVADLNGDGKMDVLVANSKGQLLYFQNNTQATELQFSTMDTLPLQLPVFASIALYDVNQDNKVDLVVGNRTGKMALYLNQQATYPAFVLQNEQWGGIDVRNYEESYFGYATPTLYDTFLLVGSESGRIYCYSYNPNDYEQLTLQMNNLFVEDENLWMPVYEGIRTAIAVQDIDNDGFTDAVIGNFSGGLAFYQGVQPPNRSVKIEEFVQNEIYLFPNPANSQLYSSLQEDVLLTFYNLLGQKVAEKTLDHSSVCDISDIKSGFYFVKIQIQSGKIYVQKLLKN